jgi:poly-gamma-glutamate capsule biosynthesis protein CapA/YwtB (metallophosphatase superfamily)
LKRLLVLLGCLSGPLVVHAAPPWPAVDPEPADAALFDPARPLAQESRLSVADNFSLALVGDMIISRPLTQAAPVPGFEPLLEVIRHSDAAIGNLETTLIDIRHFTGAPYPFAGDWANIGLPSVAPDLRRMGFGLVARANNHAMDWGLEGLRETARHLDEAGVVSAGAGNTAALARAPAYYESAKGRVALVAFATTFRPGSEAMAPHGTAPGRPGLSAVHVNLTVHVTESGMLALATASCQLYQRSCGAPPAALEFSGIRYVRDSRQFNEYLMDPADLAEVGRSIREARQHADVVIVAVHSHECAWDCDAPQTAQIPAEFLKDLAHGAIDAGADVFAITGIHNLGPIEVYRGRPVFYGLSNFFWSDIQEPVPQELYSLNRSLLEQAYKHPERATDYDLTAPLNAGSFATAFTFQSVLALVTFAHGQVAGVRLYPVSLGYGDNLRSSGTPRLVTGTREATAILQQVVDRTRAYGLPALSIHPCAGGASCIPLPR